MAACEIALTQNLFTKVEHLVFGRILRESRTSVELKGSLQRIRTLRDEHPSSEIVEAHSLECELNGSFAADLTEETFLGISELRQDMPHLRPVSDYIDRILCGAAKEACFTPYPTAVASE